MWCYQSKAQHERLASYPAHGLISCPLTNMLKNNGFKWIKEALKAFELLKEKMPSAPILRLPDFTQPFVADPDVRRRGIGAVLIQEGVPLHILARLWALKELQTILYEVYKRRHYLEGNSFIIKTDKKSIKHLFEPELQNSVLKRGRNKVVDIL